MLKQLVEHGADPKTQDAIGAGAVKSCCIECVRFLLDKGAKVTGARVADAAAVGSLPMVRLLVESGGAPVTDRSDRGYTPLMRAALSYERNQDVIAYLLAKGADPALRNELGATAHTMAKRFGPSAIVEVLRKAGAPESDAPVLPPPVKDNALRPAIERGVKLLEHSAYSVFKRRGCVSCHSNTQPAMVVAAARSAGLAVDEPEAKRNWAAMTADERARGAGSMMGTGIPEISAYTMLAWHANQEPAGARSDLAFHQLAARQEPDGHWRVDGYRPPQEYSALAATGLAVLGLKAYAPPGRGAESGAMIDRARQYLLRAKPHGVEEQAFRLLGLYWSGATAGAVREAARVLVREQLGDGGWAQLPGMAPDAYATGLALYSLNVTAGIPVTNATYRRGVRHLLDTQRPDGSWFVESRSFPFQPHFESGFPYGYNQWISAAGSSWALLALIASAGV